MQKRGGFADQTSIGPVLMTKARSLSSICNPRRAQALHLHFDTPDSTADLVQPALIRTQRMDRLFDPKRQSLRTVQLCLSVTRSSCLVSWTTLFGKGTLKVTGARLS